jgi:hypothetical protein
MTARLIVRTTAFIQGGLSPATYGVALMAAMSPTRMASHVRGA